MTNGILPDLGGFSEDTAENGKNEPVVSFSYDNTLEETEEAMKLFHNKYKRKREIMMISAYSVMTAAVIIAIIINPPFAFPLFALTACSLIFCFFGLYSGITGRKKAIKKTIEAISKMPPEEYEARFYEGKIEIDTIIKQNSDNSDNDGEKPPTPIKMKFIVGDDLLEFLENKELLVLVFNRQQFYCFPKRCLSEEQQAKAKDFLENKISWK